MLWKFVRSILYIYILLVCLVEWGVAMQQLCLYGVCPELFDSDGWIASPSWSLPSVLAATYPNPDSTPSPGGFQIHDRCARVTTTTSLVLTHKSRSLLQPHMVEPQHSIFDFSFTIPFSMSPVDGHIFLFWKLVFEKFISSFLLSNFFFFQYFNNERFLFILNFCFQIMFLFFQKKLSQILFPNFSTQSFYVFWICALMFWPEIFIYFLFWI